MIHIENQSILTLLIPLNDFLDLATHTEISKRPSETVMLIDEVKKLRRAIMNETKYLDVKISQECIFCKTGSYKILLNSVDGQNVMGLEDFGFKAVGNPRGLFMVCDHCGNFQMFRKDLCNAWAWNT